MIKAISAGVWCTLPLNRYRDLSTVGIRLPDVKLESFGTRIIWKRGISVCHHSKIRHVCPVWKFKNKECIFYHYETGTFTIWTTFCHLSSVSILFVRNNFIKINMLRYVTICFTIFRIFLYFESKTFDVICLANFIKVFARKTFISLHVVWSIDRVPYFH